MIFPWISLGNNLDWHNPSQYIVFEQQKRKLQLSVLSWAYFQNSSVTATKTRMHSSRMRTTRSSSRHGGVSTSPPEQATPLEQVPPPRQIPLNFLPGCGPGLDPPQLPPWVWAWTRSPSTSPLGVGLDQIPLNFPLGCGPGNLQGMLGYHIPPGDLLQGMQGYHLQCMLGSPPPPCGQTHTCKNISFANFVCGR